MRARAAWAATVLTLVSVAPCFAGNEAEPGGYVFNHYQPETCPARFVKGVHIVNPTEHREGLFFPENSLLSTAGSFGILAFLAISPLGPIVHLGVRFFAPSKAKSVSTSGRSHILVSSQTVACLAGVCP